MKFLILVACSVLVLSSCNSSIDKEVPIKFPVNISGFYEDMMKSARHPMWGGPIKVFESEKSLVFQISGSKDIFLLNVMVGNILKVYPNPPDTIGGMVYRYDPVSFVIPKGSGFAYLKNNSELIYLSPFAKKEGSQRISEDILLNPYKVLNPLGNRLVVSPRATPYFLNYFAPLGLHQKQTYEKSESTRNGGDDSFLQIQWSNPT